MPEVRLTTDEGGSVVHLVEEDETELFLPFHQITSIDMKICSELPNLRWLSLNSNRISELDLSPLAKCAKLEKLKLHGNTLTKLDLKPLKKCKRLRELNISFNKLSSIDLTPLKKHTQLTYMNLSINRLDEIRCNGKLDLIGLNELRINGNNFETIDLSCFENSPMLASLRLAHNSLKAIDLTFLQNSNELVELFIPYNRLTNVDLSVFESHSKIKKIDLSHNLLDSIDLWPLRNCSGFKSINLYDNQLQEVDITSLYRKDRKVHVGLGCSTLLLLDKTLECVGDTPYLNWRCKLELEYKSLRELTSDLGWAATRSRVEWFLDTLPRRDTFSFRRSFLNSLGIGELAGFNGNLIALLEKHSMAGDFDNVRDALYQDIFNEVESQLENGGPTLFLNIDEIAASRSAKLVSKLIERRKTEVEGLTLIARNGSVDVRPLWLTGYGYDILSSLGAGKKTITMSLFKEIQSSFASLGITIKAKPGIILKGLPQRFRGFRRELVDHVLLT
jgi:hypothetical protein